MKIKTVPYLITLAISVLIAYAYYVLLKGSELDVLIAVMAFILSEVTLGLAFSLVIDNEKKASDSRIAGYATFLIGAGALYVIGAYYPTTEVVIIVPGLIILIYILTIYTIIKKPISEDKE